MAIVDVHGSRINDVLGGIALPSVILICGPEKAGKSTAAAELAGAIVAGADDPSSRRSVSIGVEGVGWMLPDRNREPLQQAFHVAGFEQVLANRVSSACPGDPPIAFDGYYGVLNHFDEKLVLVLDDLERWPYGGGLRAQMDMMMAIRAHKAVLKIVVVLSRNGRVYPEIERFADATVHIGHDHALVRSKVRWNPLASVVARRR
jgi:hypothetical protein